jgi:FixJ family two-component response regulator
MAEVARIGARPRVLLVEDDAAVRRALQLLLRGQGYDVRAYASAVGLARDPEALQSACLVADLLMPETGALRLLQELRTAGWTGRAILISGHLDAQNTRDAQHEGFEVVLPKPIAENALKRSVAEMVGRSGTIGL